MSLGADLLAAMRGIHAASWKFPARNHPATYATYQKVSGRLHGTLNSGLGAQRATFQIDVWSTESFAACESIADQFKTGLPSLLKVGDISENSDAPEHDGDTIYRSSFDITLWQ